MYWTQLQHQSLYFFDSIHLLVGGGSPAGRRLNKNKLIDLSAGHKANCDETAS